MQENVYMQEMQNVKCKKMFVRVYARNCRNAVSTFKNKIN